VSTVTIIIPYKKNLKYLFLTLKSISEQSYKKFKILIIYDDTDKSDLKIIKKTILTNKKFKNYLIKIIQNKDNFGPGKSRNIGIKNSNSKYIAFIDSDDTWHKDKLKKQIKFMEKNNLPISHTSYFVVNSDEKKLSFRIAKNKIFKDDLIRSCDIGLSTVMLDTAFIKKNKLYFPTTIKTKEDYVLWLKIIEKTNIIYGLDLKLTNYRKTKNSLSSNKIVAINNGFKVYNKYMKFNLTKSIFHLLILSINSIKKNLNLYF